MGEADPWEWNLSRGKNGKFKRISTELGVEGSKSPGRLRPDFSLITDAGDVIVWEHLGMLNREDYRRGWEWKRAWYENNGFKHG